MVEARVDELERHDLAVEDARGLGVRGAFGAKARAREDHVADDGEVAFALVAVLGFVHGESLRPKPVGVERLFALALREAEPRAERDAVDDERAVGGEHHVGQTRRGLDGLDLVARRDVRGPQLLPLRGGSGPVDGPVGVHPRVDHVDDVEVGRRAHQIAPLTCGRTGCGGSGFRPGVGIQHPTSIDACRRAIRWMNLRWRSDSLLRDELDQQIIAQLVENARASFAEVGGRVGLSAPAVKRRVDRLVADGTIRGFHAEIADAARGTTTEAFVELHCRSRTNPTDIAQMVADEPDIVAVYTVTGDADALLHVKTASPSTLEAVVERVRTHQNAERTKTTIVLSRVER